MAAVYYLEFAKLFLVLIRVGSFFILNPVLGSQMIPTRVKLGMSLMTAIAIFSHVKGVTLGQMQHVIPFALLVGREFMVGIFLGLIALSFFEGIRLAGQVFGIQMGFGIVNVMDPRSQEQISIMSVFKYFMATLVFLCINGHHQLLLSIKTSFDIVPLGCGFTLQADLGSMFVSMIGRLFVIAVKISLPLMAALIVATFVLGILAKAVPKVQVFLMSFPLKIGLGLLMMSMFMKQLFVFFQMIFEEINGAILGLMRLM
ncbi:MAG: flagellar biosynthetic protein FliR [Desulfobacterales bacterium]|nr:flagellar biosynthetic protein FliR [Desulfobacterales bacterium]